MFRSLTTRFKRASAKRFKRAEIIQQGEISIALDQAADAANEMNN
jgi:hypothetical protein